MYYIYIKEINNPLRNQIMNLENIINENIKRFGTKNLSESDLKRIEEQQAEASLLQKAAAAKYSNEYRSGKLKNSFDWNWNKSDTLTVIPRVTFYGQKQEGKWPFNSVSVTYNTQTNKFDKIYVDQDEIAKSPKERLKVTTPKNLARDMKVWVAKQIVKKNEGETLNINEQEKEAEKTNEYAKGGRFSAERSDKVVNTYLNKLLKRYQDQVPDEDMLNMSTKQDIVTYEAGESSDRIDTSVTIRQKKIDGKYFKEIWTNSRVKAEPARGSSNWNCVRYDMNDKQTKKFTKKAKDMYADKNNWRSWVYNLGKYNAIVWAHDNKEITSVYG